jgi:hypothetical protein
MLQGCSSTVNFPAITKEESRTREVDDDSVARRRCSFVASAVVPAEDVLVAFSFFDTKELVPRGDTKECKEGIEKVDGNQSSQDPSDDGGQIHSERYLNVEGEDPWSIYSERAARILPTRPPMTTRGSNIRNRDFLRSRDFNGDSSGRSGGVIGPELMSYWDDWSMLTPKLCFISSALEEHESSHLISSLLLWLSMVKFDENWTQKDPEEYDSQTLKICDCEKNLIENLKKR